MESLILIFMLSNAKIQNQDNYIKQNYIITNADNTKVYMTKGDKDYDIVNIVTDKGEKYTYEVEKLEQ